MGTDVENIMNRSWMQNEIFTKYALPASQQHICFLIPVNIETFFAQDMFMQHIITTTDTEVLQIVEGNQHFSKNFRVSSHQFFSL